MRLWIDKSVGAVAEGTEWPLKGPIPAVVERFLDKQVLHFVEHFEEHHG